jgi:hypothetical protein
MLNSMSARRAAEASEGLRKGQGRIQEKEDELRNKDELEKQVALKKDVIKEKETAFRRNFGTTETGHDSEEELGQG